MSYNTPIILDCGPVCSTNILFFNVDVVEYITKLLLENSRETNLTFLIAK